MATFPFLGRSLTKRQNRLLAIGILITLIAVFTITIITPVYIAHRHYDAPLERLSKLSIRFKMLVANESEIKEALLTMRKTPTSKHYLKSNFPAIAAAEIQSLAKRTIESSRGKLTTSRIVPVVKEDNYLKIAVNVQFSCSIKSLRQILYTLETTHPFLFVDNATLRSITTIPYTPKAGVEPIVAVQFDLIGYARTSK